MPRNGSGTYTLPAGNPVISGTVIRSTWANPTMSDIGTALTQSLAKDGQTAPTANLPMAGFRHTNVSIAAAATDYARASQVQNGSLIFVAITGSIDDAYEGTMPFGTTSFVLGQEITLVWGATNVTTAPTLNINGSADWPILREDGSALEVGDLRETVPSQLLWNDTAWLLLGTTTGGGGAGVSSFNSRMGAVTLLSADVTTALGYTPTNLAGATFTGPVVLAGNASTSLQPTTLQQVQAMIAAIPGGSGVTSFNTRSGVVTLTSADVTNALTYIPVQSFNTRSGAVTLTSGDVTTALTFTPVNKAGDTFTGTINGNTASFKAYPANAVATAQGAAVNFATNTTQIWTLSSAQNITSCTGLADGDEGVIIFKNTAGNSVTWSTSVFKWDRDSTPTYTEPNLTTGPQDTAVVWIRRIGTLFFCYARIY